MPETTRSRDFEVPATLDAIPGLQTELEDFLGDALAPAAVFRLAMAVEEIVANVVDHAAPTDGLVRVAARVSAATVALEISDTGPPFDPFADAPAPSLDADLDDRAIGGLGVHLVRTLVDEVGYARAGGRNVVRLAMRRDGVEGGAA